MERVADPAPVITIVDYGLGKLRSVEKAGGRVGASVERTSAPERVGESTALILPGVGAFPEAMARIGALGLEPAIRERVESGFPLLGICLGMQLLFEGSDEHGGSP